MVKTSVALAALAGSAAAWPLAMENDALVKRAASGRLNTGGGHPNPTFNAQSQYVDVTDGGPNAFKAPGARDLRGQCPGLNAAANHGFLPRNGRATITQTVTGLAQAYGMSPDLAAFLAIAAIIISGDIPSGQWSIGGGFPSTLPLLLSNPKGIVGTHNKYEGDASIVRGDAYLNNGDVGVFQWRSWNDLYARTGTEGGLTLDKVAEHSLGVTKFSLENNPYAFWGPFSGLVAPAAHDFVVNFMSNHTAEQPGGYLNQDILKQFFAVTGTGAGASGDNPGDFVHNRGQERIPQNWYRRNTVDGYNVPDVFIDLLANEQVAPGILRLGGNTGTVNSYSGVDVNDLTGGAFTSASLFEGNNLACFAFQAAQAGGVDQLDGVLSVVQGALKPLTDQLTSLFSGLSCPQLNSNKFNSQLFQAYPGAGYGTN
ncbi:Putative chloroperoxidase [Septoria linicola]|uniref:Chloroperoxidase n=1 Tax=Septoria linicola TaxID=215465 RepID=A0A9Q9ATG8_9PEZI|nr:putative chloroperoxidase [Septoria linicola]USW50441.1 Putative chloroperoxidase [Septoria linicola]